MNNLEERLAALEQGLARERSFHEICNLMGRYQYYHTGGQMSRIGRELFAWQEPDAHCEYGPLGVFGPEKSLEFFDIMTEKFTNGEAKCLPGLLEIHQITTPLLEIAGDGQTAKGIWMSTGAILMMKDSQSETGCSFTWDTGKYAVDFLHTDEGWKIWHLHVCDMWQADFKNDPVENIGKVPTGVTQAQIDEWNAQAAAGEIVMPMGFPIPDRPTTFHYFYGSNTSAPREPEPPVPYQCFAETFSY